MQLLDNKWFLLFGTSFSWLVEPLWVLIKPVELNTSGTVNCLFFSTKPWEFPRGNFTLGKLPSGQQPLAVERLVQPHLIFVINDTLFLDGWSERKKNIKINHFSKSLPSFSTSLFPFQHWEERKIKAGIWPSDGEEPFESLRTS